MKVYRYNELSPARIRELCTRNAVDEASVLSTVTAIADAVATKGDKALLEYARRFDGVETNKLVVEKKELAALSEKVPLEERRALKEAFKNIYSFHKPQLTKEKPVKTTEGVLCWRESRAIESVGLYIPGGSAVLPSTLLMLGIPAKIAGCRNIVVCSPPQKSGTVNEYIAYAALLIGINRIYLAGGAQAIAAMAYGTFTVPKVDKIFGPGNRYVTAAKTLMQSRGKTAIDMPAGPSEVLVIADETASPGFVAADLLSQAEHGPDSQVVLVSTKEAIIKKVLEALEEQRQQLPRADIAAKALAGSFALLVNDLKEAVDFSNLYAPEHLILAVEKDAVLIPKIWHAGSVFLGHFTPEAAGDYASGTNHTLPTSGFARAYSGVSVDSFIKKITFQKISRKGLNTIGPVIQTLASLEGLQAHKEAVSIRLKKK